MCDPVTLGTALGASSASAGAVGMSVYMGLASSALQIQGQKIQAKTQRKVQANASDVERQRYLNEVSSLRTQQGQEQVAMAQKLIANQKKARQAIATATVSAGESNVAGISVDMLKNDLKSEEAGYNNSVNTQGRMLDVRRELALRDAGLGFTNNMLRINRPIEEVNYAGALMSGAQTGLSTFSALQGSGFGAKSPKVAKTPTAPAYKASSAFNISPSNYTPFKAPTTF